MEPRPRLYPNSPKESEAAFGPGRQAALAKKIWFDSAKEHVLDLDALKPCYVALTPELTRAAKRHRVE